MSPFTGFLDRSLTWSPGHVLTALVFGTAVGACFNPPAQAVMFSCTPDEAVCPDGYSCEADGCCHRDGGDIEANLGGCGLGQAASASDPATGAGTTDAPTTTTTESDPSTSSSTSSDTSTSTGDTSTSTDTGTGTESSSAGTTGSVEPANL